MSLLSVEELKLLVEQVTGPCVSIYLPTVKLGAEIQQNPIRFKNVMKLAAEKLQEYDPERRHTHVLDFLQPAQDLDRDEFWQHQDEGLAVFLAEDFLRYYKLPFPVEEIAIASTEFHLKPLLPLLTGDGKFYVLALSQQKVRVFEGTRYSIQEVEVEGLPESLETALQYDETAKDGQFRIGTTAGHGGSGPHRAGSFHGQGSPDRDEHQVDILQYFHVVNGALEDFFKNQKAPLVLVGVEYLLPLYREANTYPHLLTEGITESPKVLKAEDLHGPAWAIVEPHFIQSQQAAIEHYQELTPTEKAAASLQDVVPAAYYGRVDELFVALGAEAWGTFDPETNELQHHADAEPGDEDLLNAAAIQTLLNGGTVYAVPVEAVPEQALLAATFRY